MRGRTPTFLHAIAAFFTMFAVLGTGAVILNVPWTGSYIDWRGRPTETRTSCPAWQSPRGPPGATYRLDRGTLIANITIVATIDVVTVGLLLAIVFRSRYRKRVRDGVCPKCKYDLRGELETGCPECGWRRESE